MRRTAVLCLSIALSVFTSMELLGVGRYLGGRTVREQVVSTDHGLPNAQVTIKSKVLPELEEGAVRGEDVDDLSSWEPDLQAEGVEAMLEPLPDWEPVQPLVEEADEVQLLDEPLRLEELPQQGTQVDFRRLLAVCESDSCSPCYYHLGYFPSEECGDGGCVAETYYSDHDGCDRDCSGDIAPEECDVEFYDHPCRRSSWGGRAYLCPDPDLGWRAYDPCGEFNCAYGYNQAGTLDPNFRRRGVFMPQCPQLFPQFIADPRAINLSAGWRFNDQVISKSVIDVSYAQWFPCWRWFDVFCCGDAMDFTVEGALWAIFDPEHEASPLVNADYYIGFPLTWKFGRWSWKLRAFHISSHIGDEFLLVHPTFDRKNPSAQYLDFFVAYQLLREMRIYFGYGRIFMVDSSFPVKRNYFEWGGEVYLPYFRWNGWKYCVEGRPFLAIHIRNRQDDHYREDETVCLGYEFHKLTGLEGKLRMFLEYHKGTSLEGQFACDQTDYFSVRVSYGY